MEPPSGPPATHPSRSGRKSLNDTTIAYAKVAPERHGARFRRGRPARSCRPCEPKLPRGSLCASCAPLRSVQKCSGGTFGGCKRPRASQTAPLRLICEAGRRKESGPTCPPSKTVKIPVFSPKMPVFSPLAGQCSPFEGCSLFDRFDRFVCFGPWTTLTKIFWAGPKLYFP